MKILTNRFEHIISIIVILFLCPFLIAGCGYGIIRGVVVDKDMNPINGAIIQTTPPSQSILSSKDGYSIKKVKPGVYMVTARKIGYSEGSVNVTVKSNQVSTADIQLEVLQKE